MDCQRTQRWGLEQYLERDEEAAREAEVEKESNM
jgi:hypothetical protein